MKTWNSLTVTTMAAGLLLVMCGVFISSNSVAAFFQPDPVDSQELLLQGAAFFRLGLVGLGVIVIVLGRLPIWGQPARAQKKTRETEQRTTLAILLVLLAVAAAVRMYQLDAGLWLDEILTYENYARLPFGQIVSTYDSENQHFLYSILSHASFLVFGEGAWPLRLPAVIFGVGSIWALFLFAREVTSSREALLASALLAFSYHHVWFSQNARGYTGLLFWALLASWFFVRGQKGERPQVWLYYALSAALGIYTHMTMLFVIFGHAVLYLVTLYRSRKQSWLDQWAGFFLGFGLAGFLTFLLFSPALPQIFGRVGVEASVVQEWKSPFWTLVELIRGLQVGFATWLLVIPALFVFTFGVLSYVRTQWRVVGLLLIPAASGAAVTIALGHHLWPRFFFFAFGFGALVVVRGVMATSKKAAELLKFPGDRAIWMGTSLCILMILISAASMTFAFGPKQDYDGARTFVETQKAAGDVIVSTGLAGYVYENFYKAEWPYVETEAELDEVRDNAQRTWLVYSFVPVLEALQPGVLTTIEEECPTVRDFPGSVAAGTVTVCLIDTPAS